MSMSPLEEFLSLSRELSSRTENEAETRHKLIDVIIHGVMGWPRNRVTVEEYIQPGFADYVLTRTNSDQILFIEAKRSGVYFTLPHPHSSDELEAYIPVKQLLSDSNIAVALNQVREYCVDSGCEYAAITNGHEWIFFRTFAKGKRWDTLRAYVIRSPRYFEASYTKAFNTLSYTSITERSSLASLLGTAQAKDRPLFIPKERIPSYSHPVKANRLAATIRPLAGRYFGVIDDADSEFMNRCYVSERDYPQTLQGMRSVIHDSLTPYFASYNVRQLEDTGHGGQLGGKLKRTVKAGARGEVLILFGGKGSGKSTFIKRLLHHNPPPWLATNAVTAIIDLLKVPEKREFIEGAIWQGLVASLDAHNLLQSPRDELVSKLFRDRYTIASKQELSGLGRSTEAYNVRLNDLVSLWKRDLKYCAERLSLYWSEQNRGIIVVLDNTDQFSGDNQDFCFTSAQEISDLLGCVTLISMREERFHNSKTHGLLDAFQNSGFHISSPKPSSVFQKRLEYVGAILNPRSPLTSQKSRASTNLDADCDKYLAIISREFRSEQSPLNQFLTACAHGDTRLALDLFRSFLISGYTNVDEILLSGSWRFQTHQVIRPVMTPDRYFYDENVSDIPNLYQLRYSRHASHFTALRILRKLAQAMEGNSPAYVPYAELLSYFIETFNMGEDFNSNLDVLLRHGFVESDNRVDFFSDDLDRIKITNYGLYAYRDLAFNFTYVDLICIDCAVFSESTSNSISEAAKNEYNLFNRNEILKRLQVRLERVESFIAYLKAEEIQESELYGLGIADADLFSTRAFSSFEAEKARAMVSARRQRKVRGEKSGVYRST